MIKRWITTAPHCMVLRILFELLKVGSKGRAAIRELVGSAAGECEEIDTSARVCLCVRVCVWTSSLSPFAPSFTLLLSHKASVPFSSAGVLSGDGSSGTHVPSFWHWPWVIEMQTENALNQMGSKSSKYLAKTFFHWWSRPVYGRWNKVRADGRPEHTPFIWTAFESNKANTTTGRNRGGRTDHPISSY